MKMAMNEKRFIFSTFSFFINKIKIIPHHHHFSMKLEEVDPDKNPVAFSLPIMIAKIFVYFLFQVMMNLLTETFFYKRSHQSQSRQ